MTTVGIEIEKTAEEGEESVLRRPDRNRKAVPKLRWWLLGASMLSAILAAAAMAYYADRITTDDAQVDGQIVPIASRIYGSVIEVPVQDNQRVKTGDVIARVDPRDYAAKVDQARAALVLAESQARAAEAGVPLTRETSRSGTSGSEAQLAAAESEYARARLACELASTSDLGAAQAAMDARQANSDRTQADLARMRPLAEKAEISKLQFDAYQAAARVAASELKAAKEKLTSASKDAEIRRAAMTAAKAAVDQARAGVETARARHRQVDISVAQLSSAAAGIEAAMANLRAAELQLSYATILAPTDGVVTRKSVEVGQIIQPGQGLMSLVPLERVWVTANFKETQLARVRPGQRVEIQVDMYETTFAGHIDSIAGATGTRLSLLPPENATGNFVKVVQRIPVKIALDPISPDQAVLRPGMNVIATVFTK